MSAPELTLIQLSDTHIGADGELLHGLVDTFATLRRAIGTVLAAGTPSRGRNRDAVCGKKHAICRSGSRGSLLVVHHPPLPSPAPTANLLRLTGIEDLVAVLKGTDVRMILSGHSHHTGCGQLAGIPVWVSPAPAYRLDALPPRGRLRGHVGAGVTRIDLIDGTFVATAIELGEAATVYEQDREEMVHRITEAISRDG